MFITIAFDDEDIGEKFLEAMDLRLDFKTAYVGTMQVYHEDVRPTRIIKTEFVTKED